MLNLTSNDPPAEPDKDGWKSIASTIGLIILAPAIALFISAFIIQSYQVDGQSMETSYHNGDRLLVNKFPRTISRLTHHAYVPKRGDVIIFNQEGLDIGFSTDKQLIKRVIGLPGERVVVRDNQITVYNQERPQGFDPDVSGLYHLSTTVTVGSVDLTLGKDEIFVSGDNRANSEDSRYFGPVNVRNIVGIMSVRVLPLGQPHHPD
jgi:signal peptidase I